MKRTLVVSAAGVLVLLAGLRFWPRASAEAKEGAALPELSAQAVLAEKGPVPSTVSVTGTVRPALAATLSSKVMARVVGVGAREGDRVAAGRTLITLDARDQDAAVNQARASVDAARSGVDVANTATELDARQVDSRIAAAEANLRSASARLDLANSGPRKQERQQASLAVAQAEASLQLAEADYRRYKSLFDQQALPGQALDQAETKVTLARAQVATAKQAESMVDEGTRSEEIRAAREAVAAAKAELDSAKAAKMSVQMRRAEAKASVAGLKQSAAALRSAEVMMSYHTIAAPFDGVVAKRYADPGTMAGPGAPLLLVEGGALRLEASAPESVLKRVKLGQTLPVTLDALPGRTFRGRVAEIVPSLDPRTHTAIVKVELPSDSGAFSGMYGRAEIATGASDAVLVPTVAVVQREGMTYVWIADSERKARLRLVTTGGETGGRTVVLTGLNGREVVLVGAHPADGQPVKVAR